MAHQIEDVEVEEAEYDENADEDFSPETAQEDGDASSSSEDEEDKATAKPTKPTGRRKKRKPETTAADELDSGDEATIQERQRKRRKRDVKDNKSDDESGGEGGLIKTRAQRLAEKVEKKYRRHARDGDVTVDVDQLWEDLSRMPIGRHEKVVLDTAEMMELDQEGNKENAPTHSQGSAAEEDMITIKRRIEYAGEVTEVEERVPRTSKEAQRYLAEHPEDDPNHKARQADTVLRPMKRASMFEPNPTALVKGVPPDRLRPRAPSRLDVVMAAKRAEEERQRKAERMTTVQKSALDWRGFVDNQAGLREELDEYGKSKRGYLAREEFLGRAELTREMRGREARLKL